MCTRFVFRGESDIVTGFNFDIDLAVWDHRLIVENDRFYIGILRPDRLRHGYHGVHANGNAGTLLYVHGDPAGAYRAEADCVTVADLTEDFISGALAFDDVRALLTCKTVTYAPDATMQAMLTDARGRTLIIEPGIGWREEKASRFSLITNYSLIDPPRTAPYIVPGDDRYARAQALLAANGNDLSVADALEVLATVRQEGAWATRLSFVYSQREQAVTYCENGDFTQTRKVVF